MCRGDGPPGRWLRNTKLLFLIFCFKKSAWEKWMGNAFRNRKSGCVWYDLALCNIYLIGLDSGCYQCQYFNTNSNQSHKNITRVVLHVSYQLKFKWPKMNNCIINVNVTLLCLSLLFSTVQYSSTLLYRLHSKII